MSEKKSLIKTIQTYAGNVYVYVPASNQIITLDREWVASISLEEREATILTTLQSEGIDLNSQAEKYVLSFSPDELWDSIEHHVKCLTLEVTQQCSLRCTYCIYSGNYANERTHSGVHMSLEMMQRCIDYYYDHSLGENDGSIGFYGGESLLQFKEIQFAIKYARTKWKKKKIDFQISTNGTTLTPSILHWLNEQADTSVAITCNGERHDEYRRFPDGSGSLDVIMQAVERIRSFYPSLWERTYFIANITSKGELLSLRKFYMERIGKPPAAITGIKLEYGNENIRDIVAHEDTEADEREVLRLYCEGDPYILPYVNIDGICKRQIGKESSIEKKGSFCKPLAHELFIDANGKFKTCESICSDLDFGDIENGYSKEKIIAMVDRVQTALQERCSSCWGRRLCYACFSDINLDIQGHLVFPEAACKEECADIAYTLRAFCEMRERNPKKLSEIIEKYRTVSNS